jgi:hypothetical protein
MAVLIHTDGRVETVFPRATERFTLDELRGFVDGPIDIQHLGALPSLILFHNDDGSTVVLDTTGGVYDLVFNDEFLFGDLPRNAIATELAGQHIAGDVLLARYPDEVQ